jgi:penicillin-binding protein 1A
VLADPSLGITQEMEFKRPVNFSINLDCGDVQEKKTPTDFDDFF